MHHFPRFVYRFFACLMLLAIAACGLWPQEESGEQVPLPPLGSGTVRSSAPPTSPAMAAKPPEVVPAPAAEDFAPASHLSKDGVSPAGEGEFAASSHMG